MRPRSTELSPTTGPFPEPSTPGTGLGRPRSFTVALAGLLVASAAVVGWFGRTVFLFSDDFVFLIEGRQAPGLDWSYLSAPLFGHFSPVSRVVHFLVAGALPGHAWLIPLALFLAASLVVAGVTVAMTALFGRTWLTLVGIALAGPGLSLLPLLNWWTAGINLMPAIAGVALAFGGAVQYSRGRSPWWGALAVGGYLLALLSWELGLLAPAFIGLWVLLFRYRVTDEPLSRLLRRSWWMWAGFAVFGAAGLINYRLNYYAVSPRPPLSLAAEAYGVSLTRAQLPLTVGAWSSDGWLSIVGPVLGVGVGLVAVGWTLWRSGRAWRGWLFAGTGWFVPVSSLVLSRVGYIGVPTVEQPMYYHFGTLMVLIGALEAIVAPSRNAATARRPTMSSTGRRPARRALVGAVSVAYVVLFAASAGPTVASTNYAMVGGTAGDQRGFVEAVLASAAAVAPREPTFSMLDGTVPAGLVDYPGHNRLGQVIGLVDPTLPFNHPTGPWFTVDAHGQLQPVEPRWDEQLSLSGTATPAAVQVSGGSDVEIGSDGLCFTPASSSTVAWRLAAPISTHRVLVRITGTFGASTAVQAAVITAEGATVPADGAGQDQPAGTAQWLQTVSDPDADAHLTATSVELSGFVLGARSCLTSVAVGTTD